jgi:hypothetical protein
VAGKIVEKSQPSISKTVRQDIDDADDEESYYKWLEVKNFVPTFYFVTTLGILALSSIVFKFLSPQMDSHSSSPSYIQLDKAR